MSILLLEKIKKNPVLYFLLKLFVFFVIVFILDFSIGNTLRHFYFKQESGLEYRTTYSIENTKADILIFGSSRANHHYPPDIFERRLHASFYNVGRDGNFIFYHYAVLKSILKRYSPKIVILDFTRGEFVKSQENYDRISSLLPYYRTHPEIRSIVELKNPFEKLKLLSSIYPYNSSLFTIAVGNTEFNKKRKADDHGYVPLSNQWDEPIQKSYTPGKFEIDPIEVKLYNSFIQDCINAKVKLYIVCSPYFIKFNYIDYSERLGQEIAIKYRVPFFDYSNDSTFISNSKLFDDPYHLNNQGAEIFSNMLIDTLIKTMHNTTPSTLLGDAK